MRRTQVPMLHDRQTREAHRRSDHHGARDVRLILGAEQAAIQDGRRRVERLQQRAWS